MNSVILPYRTDWREMSGVLEYCKGKGVERSLLDARFGGGEGLRETLNALEQLRLIVRDETTGDVRLTPLGERLAYAPDVERRQAVLAEAMLGYIPYRIPLERALDDRLDVLDAPWVEHVWQVDMRLGQPRNRVEEARTFFFRLADEAGLGAYRRGVRGQTTRLELDADARSAVQHALSSLDEVFQQEDDLTAVPEAGQSGAEISPAHLSEAEDSRPPAARAPTGNVYRAQVPLGASTSMTIHVDLTEWDIEKIETFLRLIGYIPSDEDRPGSGEQSNG